MCFQPTQLYNYRHTLHTGNLDKDKRKVRADDASTIIILLLVARLSADRVASVWWPWQ